MQIHCSQSYKDTTVESSPCSNEFTVWIDKRQEKGRIILQAPPKQPINLPPFPADLCSRTSAFIKKEKQQQKAFLASVAVKSLMKTWHIRAITFTQLCRWLQKDTRSLSALTGHKSWQISAATGFSISMPWLLVRISLSYSIFPCLTSSHLNLWLILQSSHPLFPSLLQAVNN